VYIVDLDKGTFIASPGFPSVLPAHELRTLEMSLEAIVASGKSKIPTKPCTSVSVIACSVRWR
jgi:hypothetical protein